MTTLPQYNDSTKFFAGIDEVGRGPWAGPVTTAAVSFKPEFYASKLPKDLLAVTDSKKLKPQQREELAAAIYAHPMAEVSLASASVEEVDELNIRRATLLAMRRAVEGLTSPVEYAYIDGRDVPPNLPCPAEAVIKGDAKVFAIACASIVAKVARDKLMCDLHEEFPFYGWDTNAGYGTKAHQTGLTEHGVTPHHRTSFRPIAEIITQGN